MAENDVLPKGSTILITGVNGFVGSHCADFALARGFRVRGTVRSIEKAAWLVEVLEKKHGKGLFEPVVVQDMATPGAFDEVIQGCAAAVHPATVVTRGGRDEVIPPTIAGATEVLKSAAKTPSIKRVVYTSSQAALTHVEPDTPTETTRDSWNERAVTLAKDMSHLQDIAGSVTVYSASKVLAEQACFSFMAREKPCFVFNSVVCYCITGPLLDANHASSTGGIFKGLWYGDEQVTGFMRNIGPLRHIDVRDVAALHLAATLYADVQNERLMGIGDQFNLNNIVDVFAKIDPGHKLPERIEGDPKDMTQYGGVDRSVELLRRMGRDGWISFEDSIRAGVAAL